MKKVPIGILAGTVTAVLLAVGVGASTGASATPLTGKASTSAGQQAPLTNKDGVPDATFAPRPVAPLGSTQYLKAEAFGRGTVRASGPVTAAGNYSQIDLLAPLNYCYRDWVYTPVKNNTATARSFQIQVLSGGIYRTYYSSVAANSAVYPYFQGLTGTYTARLYLWNGSSYAYDEQRTGSNNCSISIAMTRYNTSYIREVVKNTGTAYATVISRELAPYNYSAVTDSPAPGGGTFTRYHYVATGLRWAIAVDISGSSYNAWNYTGN